MMKDVKITLENGHFNVVWNMPGKTGFFSTATIAEAFQILLTIEEKETKND